MIKQWLLTFLVASLLAWLLYAFVAAPLTHAQACDTTITAVQDLENAVNTETAYNVFCVNPADHDTLRITRDGTHDSRVTIRHSSGGHAHAKDSANTVFVRYLELTGEHTTWDGITFAGDTTNVVFMDAGSGQPTHTTIIRSLFESRGGPSPAEQRALLFVNKGDTLMIDSTVFRNTAHILTRSYNAIDLSITKGSTFQNSECTNLSGDCIHFAQTSNNSGFSVLNNYIAIDSTYWTDCAGNKTTSGTCSCSENALDVKGVRGDTTHVYPRDQWITIKNNVIRGWKDTDENCAGSGTLGPAVILQNGNSNSSVVAGNLFIGNDIPIRTLTKNDGTPHNVEIRDNIFDSTMVQALRLDGNRSMYIHHNTITRPLDVSVKFDDDWMRHLVFTQNMIEGGDITTTLADSSNFVGGNMWLGDTTATLIFNNQNSDDVILGGTLTWEQRCYTFFPLTAPQQRCFNMRPLGAPYNRFGARPLY